MRNFFITDGISDSSIEQMLHCFRPQFRAYRQGETIMRYSDKIERVGLIRKGRAQLYTLDVDGSGNLLEEYQDHDIFGELFHFPLDGFEYIVEAVTDAEVIFIDYQHIIRPCEKVCAHHSQLINNLFLMAAERSQSLSLHLNILNQPSIRKKLLTYLHYLQGSSGSNSITIPLTLSALAEYLCVDRSAMTREIQKLNQEGVVKSSRRKFLICK